MQKCLLILKIKPEARKEYIEIHENPWREMLEAIRDSGFVNEMIWYYEDLSIIYFEHEDYVAGDKLLRTMDACKKWDIKMAPYFAGEAVMPPKIFDLQEQLHGELKQFEPLSPL